jgi:dienelactone hydrolase
MLRKLSMLLAVFWLALLCANAQKQSPRVLTITSRDGAKLKATYFPAAQPGPGILLLHQCNRDRAIWNDLGRRMSEAGFHVLALDFRGFGESEGTAWSEMNQQQIQQMTDTTWHDDVDTAFQVLISQPGVSRGMVGAGGASCGVNQAVQLALRHSEVKALMLLSETTNRAGREFIRKSPGMPLFLAVADDDPDLGVVEVMQWLRSLSPNPDDRFERYANGGHGVDMFNAHPELPAAILSWFQKTLTYASKQRLMRTPSQKPHVLELTDQPGGTGQLEKLLNQSPAGSSGAIPFSEAAMNRIAYEHLLTGDTDAAVQLFKLNIAAYPQSPNAYDSLSDAYFAIGEKELARQSAAKALQLLEVDTTDSEQRRKAIQESAERKLKQMKDTMM